MSLSELEVWHFDFSHLQSEQTFILHQRGQNYPISPHTPETLARSHTTNSALCLISKSRITHFVPNVAAPAQAVSMWRVTAAKLREDDLLDRLVYTGIRYCQVNGHSAIIPG